MHVYKNNCSKGWKITRKAHRKSEMREHVRLVEQAKVAVFPTIPSRTYAKDVKRADIHV